MWTFDPGEPVDAGFFERRVDAAVAYREQLGFGSDEGPLAGSACRLVNAESDGFPGLIADRYGDTLVLQFQSAGVERWRDTIASALAARCGTPNLYERSDTAGRRKEGLEARTGVITGQEPVDGVEVTEGRLRFLVDPCRGHKTGFYLDQRDNRRLCGELVRGRSVLNAFSFTGGFTVAALAGGADSVTEIESSSEALDHASRNLALNGLDASRAEAIHGNVFEVLRSFRDARRRFDAIVLDPPKFVHSRAQLESGSRGYKDINLLAMKLLNPGGWLLTFSCSEPMSPELFRKVVAGAAVDAGVAVRVAGWLGAPPDHPVALSFPEGRYLKGLLCRVDG
jgi:23S rRNA (cytosine1962-C5)-methyltransferase